MPEYTSRRIPAKSLQYELMFSVDYCYHGLAHLCSQLLSESDCHHRRHHPHHHYRHS